jgi:hypothetical protein
MIGVALEGPQGPEGRDGSGGAQPPALASYERCPCQRSPSASAPPAARGHRSGNYVGDNRPFGLDEERHEDHHCYEDANAVQQGGRPKRGFCRCEFL